MMTLKQQARFAGLLYFLVALIAPVSLIYVPNKVYVRDDAVATADHIRAFEPLLRFSIATELLHEVLWVFVVLALYRLFKPINGDRARLMLILGALIPVPIVCLNVLNEIAATLLAGGTAFLGAFNREQLDTLALLFFRLHGQGLNIASIFWGLWLLPFGALVIRSGFIPWMLGWLLILAGIGYVAGAFATLMLPTYAHQVDAIAGILEFGEVPIIFWLLLWGIKAADAA